MQVLYKDEEGFLAVMEVTKAAYIEDEELMEICGPEEDIAVAIDAKSAEKGRLKPGSLIKITGEANGWNSIETDNGLKGWVNGDYINLNGPVNAKVQKVISVAKAQMGKPYRWGATDQAHSTVQD